MKNTNYFFLIYLSTLLLIPLGSGCFEAGKTDDEETETTTETTTETATETDIACEELSVDECGARTDCATLSGLEYVYSDEMECHNEGESIDISCLSADTACPAVESFASSGDGNCVLFGGCTPDGWEGCEPLVCEADPLETCWDISVEACSDRTDCIPISGLELDINYDLECYQEGDYIAVGCMPADIGCDDAITYASSPIAEECMMFYSGCIPNGWESCDLLNVFGECSEPEENTLGECEPAYSDTVRIAHLSLSGDELGLLIEYSGGCEVHDFEFCWNGLFMESLPVQVDLALGHNANNDACDGWITEQLFYDISHLRQSYEAAYGPGGSIWIHVGDESIEYSF